MAHSTTTRYAYIVMSTQYVGILLDNGIDFCDTAYEYLMVSMTCKIDGLFLRI